MVTLTVFLAMICVLVVVHELGHYFVARLCNVHTLVFSVGIGPEIWGFNSKSGTRWRISLLPIGGYVRFCGEEDEENRPDSYSSKNAWQRLAILFAGPGANLLLAVMIFAGVFLFYDGSRSIPLAFERSVMFSQETVTSQISGIADIVSGKTGIEGLAGPVGIAKISGSVFENHGVPGILMVTGIISISLAIINLLPIPALDGGHILLCIIEILKGSPVSKRAQIALTKVGLFFILFLFVFLLINDIQNF